MGQRGRPKQVASIIRLIVENGKEHPAYVRLLDSKWNKERVNVDVRMGEMIDPTIGKLANIDETLPDILANQPDGTLLITDAFLWCPALSMHAECFTFHAYEETGKETFDDLRILYFRVSPDQVQPDRILCEDVNLTIKATTRISFILPAFAKMYLDLHFKTKE